MKLLGILLGLLLVLVIQTAAAQAATDVYVNPVHTDTSLGGSFSIAIDISTDDNIYAAQFDLLFDNTILNATSATEGSFLKQGGAATYPIITIDNSLGKISYASTRFGVQTGATGTGSLLAIDFDAIGAGTSGLDLDNVELVDPGLQPVTATVTDGSAKVNQLPSATNLQIAPASPYTTDSLVGSYNYSDPDGDAESGSEIRWYKDGMLQPAYNDLLTVPYIATLKGEVWNFTVRPSDGLGFGGMEASPTVTIQNSPPTAPSAAILIISPKTTDDLECTIVSPSTDPDGDNITYSYAWYKDSVLQPGLTGNMVLSSLTSRDETWRCVVTPNDGEVGGPSDEDEVTVDNTPPTISNVHVTSLPRTDDDLMISYNYSDIDGDPESGSEIRWYKDDVLQPAYNDQLTVPSSATSKGEDWYFTITPSDGTDFGIGVTNEDITIENTPPTMPSVNVTPAHPTSSDDLTCSATGSIDIDGDTVTYYYAWYKDGLLQTGLTGTTVSSSLTKRGETWTCAVTPNDGEENGPTGEDEVTVQNRAPEILAIGPGFAPGFIARTGYGIQFTHTSQDPDYDALTYSWKLNGAEKASTTSWLFVPTTAECGDTDVMIVVSDGLLSDSATFNLDISLAGDVDLDDEVDIFDLAAVGLAYGSQPGDVNWDENADINPGPGTDGTREGDDTINIFDLAMVGLNYGEIC